MKDNNSYLPNSGPGESKTECEHPAPEGRAPGTDPRSAFAGALERWCPVCGAVEVAGEWWLATSASPGPAPDSGERITAREARLRVLNATTTLRTYGRQLGHENMVRLANDLEPVLHLLCDVETLREAFDQWGPDLHVTTDHGFRLGTIRNLDPGIAVSVGDDRGNPDGNGHHLLSALRNVLEPELAGVES